MGLLNAFMRSRNMDIKQRRQATSLEAFDAGFLQMKTWNEMLWQFLDIERNVDIRRLRRNIMYYQKETTKMLRTCSQYGK